MPLSTSEAISEDANHFEDVTVEGLELQSSFDESEEPTPTEAYLEEIQEQVEAPRTEDEEDPLVRDTRSTCSHSSMHSTCYLQFGSYIPW